MMTNLFSIFDPCLSLFGLSWSVCLVLCLVLPPLYWMSGNFISGFLSFVGVVVGEVGSMISSPVKGVFIYISTIFMVVGLYNFLALFPFVFSVTSHMLVTLPFSFVFWFCIMIFSWFNYFKSFLVHLIPVGTPIFLMSFMVWVEILSNFIRPIALTFRLTANMMAGHLLMSLIGGALLCLPFSFVVLGSTLQSLLVFMELGVSLVQAYVFSSLLLLYMSEVGH